MASTCSSHPAYLFNSPTPEMLKALRSPAREPFTLFNAGFPWGCFLLWLCPGCGKVSGKDKQVGGRPQQVTPVLVDEYIHGEMIPSQRTPSILPDVPSKATGCTGLSVAPLIQARNYSVT